jgi:hypothetical protein|tara:strand:- start:420 stop:638 length:219 start_codon:yes stop_codon:yes gene_type:complete
MKKNIKLFTNHPHSIDETYLEHMICASSYGFKMIFAGFASIIHAVFPFLFETKASECAKQINKEVEQRKKIQ